MTKNELAHLVLTEDELKMIDYALPQPFVDDCINLLNIDPRPFMVWMYDKAPLGGRPFNLAERFYMMYNKAQKLWDAGINVIVEVSERNDNVDEEGKMRSEFLCLGHALDAITLDKREIFEPPKVNQN